MIERYCQITGTTYRWYNGEPGDPIEYTHNNGLCCDYGCIYDWFLDTARVSDFRESVCPPLPIVCANIAYQSQR